MSEKETKIDWTEDKCELSYEACNYPTYQHMDYCNFQQIPVSA